jgi:hypothetical protein
MNKTLWEMPVPPSSIAGPSLKVLGKRRYELSFSIETNEGAVKTQTLLFSEVEAFRCTHMKSLGSIDQELRSQSYGRVISIFESPWLQEVRQSYGNYCATARLVPNDLQHLMITFDDGPCYEFICGDFRVV